MATAVVTRPATAEDFHRLADLAQERGLRVFEASPSSWWCTSHSNPLRLHVVTGFSCDCAGFISHQRCSHHAALLDHLGWLPEIEAPMPIASRPCPSCPSCTNGKIEEWGVGGPIGWTPCTVCGGTGRKPAPRPYGLPSIQPVAAAA